MSTKYPHGFRSPLDKSPDSPANQPQPGEDTSTWACPPTLREFVSAVRGRPLTYVEEAICDVMDEAVDLPPERLVMHVPYKSGRVPRALTDVQRRGGRGTP